MGNKKKTRRRKARKGNVEGVEGQSTPGISRGGYYGSLISAENRRKYENKIIEQFKEKVAQNPEDFKEFDKDQIEGMARVYANEITNKEQKHLKAYLKGKEFFTYKGKMYPVVSERFLKQSISNRSKSLNEKLNADKRTTD